MIDHSFSIEVDGSESSLLDESEETSDITSSLLSWLDEASPELSEEDDPESDSVSDDTFHWPVYLSLVDSVATTEPDECTMVAQTGSIARN